jgi:hypothetical protein
MCHVQSLENDFYLNTPRGENKKKEPSTVWTILKTIFLIFEKLPCEQYISKKLFYFKNKFSYFQSYNYKLFMKIDYVSRVFLMFKALNKNMWIGGFFCIKSFFPLSNVHQIGSIFL